MCQWTKEEILFLKNNYTKMNTDEIAIFLNRTKNSIKIKANKLGLKKEDKYNYDKEYFKDINSEEKAYWLGFLYADGYIVNNKKKRNYEVGIELKLSDFNHLKKFNKSLSGNIEIKERTRETFQDGKKHNSCFIRIYSSEMVKDLINNGCVERKTFIIKFPHMREDLIKHFIRGFFDGDGSIYLFKKRNHMYANITSSSKCFLESIQKILNDNNIKSYITKDRNMWKMDIKGKENANNFFKYMYVDSNIYLDRKYNKWQAQ